MVLCALVKVLVVRALKPARPVYGTLAAHAPPNPKSATVWTMIATGKSIMPSLGLVRQPAAAAQRPALMAVGALAALNNPSPKSATAKTMIAIVRSITGSRLGIVKRLVEKGQPPAKTANGRDVQGLRLKRKPAMAKTTIATA